MGKNTVKIAHKHWRQDKNNNCWGKKSVTNHGIYNTQYTAHSTHTAETDKLTTTTIERVFSSKIGKKLNVFRRIVIETSIKLSLSLSARPAASHMFPNLYITYIRKSTIHIYGLSGWPLKVFLSRVRCAMCGMRSRVCVMSIYGLSNLVQPPCFPSFPMKIHFLSFCCYSFESKAILPHRLGVCVCLLHLSFFSLLFVIHI